MRARQRLHCTSDSPREAGFSLVELMVAMVIGLTLMAGLVTLVTNSSRTLGEMTKASRQLDNGRYAVQVLSDAIQHAGFYGRFSALEVSAAQSPQACSANPGVLSADLGLPIQGYDAPASVPSALPCLPDSGVAPGTDILVLRRAETATTGIGALQTGTVYLQSVPAPTAALGLRVAAATGSADDAILFDLQERDGTPAPIRVLRVDIYFISPCRSSEADGACPVGHDAIPTLKRLEMPAGRLVTIADGIEDLQIDYGIDADYDGTPDASGGSFYVTDPTVGTGESLATENGRKLWANVMSTRVHVLARSLDPTSGYVDTKTYNMGAAGTRDAFEDAFKRHVFSSAVRATNPSSRRES